MLGFTNFFSKLYDPRKKGRKIKKIYLSNPKDNTRGKFLQQKLL